MICDESTGLTTAQEILEGPRLGIDLGGTSITAVVMGKGAEVLGAAEGLTGDHTEVCPVLDRIVLIAKQAITQAGIRAADLISAGIGLPGEIDPVQGTLRSSPILPTWHNLPVGPMLQKRLGVSFAIENDANAGSAP